MLKQEAVQIKPLIMSLGRLAAVGLIREKADKLTNRCCSNCFFSGHIIRTGKNRCGVVPCAISIWVSSPGFSAEEIDKAIELLEIAVSIHG